jgi:hypothetical protein
MTIPAEIHGQLGGQRTGTKLRERKTFDIIPREDPAPGFYQVALHVSGKCNRAAEPKRAQAQEIKEKGSESRRHQLASRSFERTFPAYGISFLFFISHKQNAP